MVLAAKLAASKGAYPMTFGRVVALISRLGDPARTILSGMTQLRLTHFPCVSFIDTQRHANIYWNGKSVYKIIYPSEKKTLREEAFSMTSTIKLMLHEKELMYQSVIQKKLGTVEVFPWMEMVID